MIPTWFFKYHLIFYTIFTILTFTVGKYSLKVYNLTKQKQTKYFGISFLFLSAHYLIQLILNSLIKINVIENIQVNNLISYIHLSLFLFGLIILTSMTLKIENKKTILLITIITLVSIIFSTNATYMFYLLASIYLAYISLFYVKNYVKNREINSLISLVAFIFLLFGNAHFLFTLNHDLYYVISHYLELAAYTLIILNLKLMKNGKKKK